MAVPVELAAVVAVESLVPSVRMDKDLKVATVTVEAEVGPALLQLTLVQTIVAVVLVEPENIIP